MNLVPWRVRNWSRNVSSRIVFAYALRRLASLGGKLPTRTQLKWLRFGWNNDSFVADLDYMEAVCQAARDSKGPILECGSGLTTLLLTALGLRQPAWVFEDSDEWRLRVESGLARLKHERIRLCRTPLRDYGAFAWYELPAGLPSRFWLVVCDGPPAVSTPGGRYGLLLVMHSYLGEGTLILLDDADRAEEREAVARWLNEYPLQLAFQSKDGGFLALQVTQPLAVV